jgi:hypothetical protein
VLTRWEQTAKLVSGWRRAGGGHMNCSTLGRPEDAQAELFRGGIVIILGLILLVLGFFLKIQLLYIVGGILLVVGVVLMILGSTGRAIGGRRHYY